MATAVDSSTPAASLSAALGSGLWLVGRFGGLQEGAFSRFLLHGDPRQDGRVFSDRVDFRRFSQLTGELLPVAASLAQLSEGDRIAVRVRVRVHEGGTSRRTGKAFSAFVGYYALAVVPLGG